MELANEKGGSVMYLSNLFLRTIGNDYSIESVKRAVEVCDGLYKTKIEDGTITGQEMYDFYDVYKEFAKDISVIEFEILQQLAFMGMLLRFQKVC